MPKSLEIRESTPDDASAIEALYPDAFPDEDLLPLVRDLMQETPISLSLAGVVGSTLVGHVIFTRCGLPGREDEVALLGPLAVAPERQRQGVGSALVHAGLQIQESAGVPLVCVLGDPVYYRRFGFSPERRVLPPYPLPSEWRDAWQSIMLRDVKPALQGNLSVPQPWRCPALWSG